MRSRVPSYFLLASLCAVAALNSSRASAGGPGVVCNEVLESCGYFPTSPQVVFDDPDPQRITFDFEDGLQGWTLEGSAERVNTQVLGGEWAIFGDGLAEGGASMSRDVNLTGVDSVLVDYFYLGTVDPMPLVLLLLVIPEDLPPGMAGRLISPTQSGENQLRFDVAEYSDMALLQFSWALPIGFPEPVPDDLQLALADNIRLAPIPEPSTFLLCLGGLLTLARSRQRRL